MKTYFLAGARETYKVNEQGEIARPSIGMHEFSAQWRITGAVRRNNFGRTVERVPFPECMTIKDWRHKNGTARWRVTDFDHGTHRVWGETVRNSWEGC